MQYKIASAGEVYEQLINRLRKQPTRGERAAGGEVGCNRSRGGLRTRPVETAPRGGPGGDRGEGAGEAAAQGHRLVGVLVPGLKYAPGSE